MRDKGRIQPPWGRPLGALFAVVIVVAMTRPVWGLVVGLTVVALSVGGYLLQRHAHHQSVHDRRRA